MAESELPTTAQIASLAEATGPDAALACPLLPECPEQIGPYRIEGEIARGGMGVVLRAHDPQFGRTLAIKLLLARDADNQAFVQRLLDETRITAQLQHPGIAPVHERGTLEDGRPYFSMKLIQGHTLAELLGERRGPAEDLPRFLTIFAQVCQTLAYAHNRGVIHRDLKPANVMVGAFGEVQVMDWGLAKVLDKKNPVEEAWPESVLESPRAGNVDQATRIGSVMGTPAYMAPEQAQGLVHLVDARSDVFGLGAMLCQILSGSPPYAGPSDALLDARKGSLDDAFERLNQCGAELELVNLAKLCLSLEPQDRPRDAGELAESVARYQASVQQRLRGAELDRAAALVKAGEEGKRRKLTVALAVALLGLVLIGVVGAVWWLDHQAASRQEEATREEKELHQAIALALEAADDKQLEGKWGAARALLEQVLDRTGATALPHLRQRLEGDIRHLDFMAKVESLRLKKVTLIEGKADRQIADEEFEQAFKTAGLDFLLEDPAALAERIASSPNHAHLVAAVDEWAANTPDATKRARLLRIARLADPDPTWGDQFRDDQGWNNLAVLEKLATQVGPMQRSSTRLANVANVRVAVLAMRLSAKGGDAIAPLKAAHRQYPADFWLNFHLGNALHQVKDSQEALGYFRAALAVRPESSRVLNNLGVILQATDRPMEALASFQDAVKLDSTDAAIHYNLGCALHRLGKSDEAKDSFKKAIKLDPGFALPEK